MAIRQPIRILTHKPVGTRLQVKATSHPNPSLIRPRTPPEHRKYGHPAPFVYRNKKPTMTLSAQTVTQIRKFINRHIHHHMAKTSSTTTTIQQRMKRNLERRLRETRIEFANEIKKLHRIWKATAKRTGWLGTQQKKATTETGARIPAWLKHRLRAIHNPKATTTAPMILFMEPERHSPLQEVNSPSREGLDILLNLLNAIPNAPPILRRLVRSLRHRKLPITLQPPKIKPLGSAPIDGQSGAQDEHLRKPLRGILRMRIEPPEAAHILAQHLPLGELPLVLRQPAKKQETPRRKPQNQQAMPAEGNLDLELPDVRLERIAETVRASIKKDLLEDLPPAKVRRLADQVYNVIENRIAVERQRRGLG